MSAVEGGSVGIRGDTWVRAWEADLSSSPRRSREGHFGGVVSIPFQDEMPSNVICQNIVHCVTRVKSDVIHSQT